LQSAQSLRAPRFTRSLQEASLGAQALAVLVGSLLIAASAQIEVPMWPVPMTMQTFAVLAVGSLYGWRLGGLTLAAYVVEGAVGLPVFSGFGSGIAHLLNTTGGYIAGFVAAAMLTGWLVERGVARTVVGSAAVFALGHALILAMGTSYLALFAVIPGAEGQGIGWAAAIAGGFMPFIFGTVLKSALNMATLFAVGRFSVTQ
jgi:biotin transport system substrate-specific component